MRPRRERSLPERLVRHLLGGLLAGAVVGFLAALILPRRYPAPPGSYQAPIPPQATVPVMPGADRPSSAGVADGSVELLDALPGAG